MRPFLLLAFLLLVPMVVQAQEADTLVVQLAPIEITATPFGLAPATAALSTSRVTRSGEALNRTAALTLDRLAYGVPGVYIGNRENWANGPRILIRGLGWRAQFGVRGVQVLHDGIPLTVADGQAVLDVVDPAFVRQVEVLRGPASVFWGNAAGGVLAFATQPPATDRTQLRLRQLGGAYGLSKTEVQVTPLLGPHRLSIASSYLAQDGYRDHSRVRLSRTLVTSTWDLGQGQRLRVFGALSMMPHAESPGGIDAEAVAADPQQVRAITVERDARKEVNQGQLGVAYVRPVGHNLVQGMAYGAFRSLDNAIVPRFIQLRRQAGGGRLTWEHEAARLRWGLGTEVKLQRDDRTERTNEDGHPSGAPTTDQLETVAGQALFGQLQVPLGALTLSTGLRADRLRFEADYRLPTQDDGTRTFQALSPSVGLQYTQGTTQIFANLGTALDAPTTTELGNRADGRGGFNPDLEPERTLSVEAGVRGQSPRLQYDLAFFALRVDDLLLPFEVDDITFFRNEGQTRHLGLEAAATWQLISALEGVASYSFTQARFLDATTADGLRLDDNAVPGIPPHLARAAVTWHTPLRVAALDDLRLTAEVEASSGYEVNSTNTAEADSYAVVHLRLDARIPFDRTTRLTPFIGLNNVFDTAYAGSVVVNAFGGRYFEPAAGRHVQVGVALQVN